MKKTHISLSLLWQHCDLTIEPMQPKCEWVKLSVKALQHTVQEKIHEAGNVSSFFSFNCLWCTAVAFNRSQVRQNFVSTAVMGSLTLICMYVYMRTHSHGLYWHCVFACTQSYECACISVQSCVYVSLCFARLCLLFVCLCTTELYLGIGALHVLL